MRNRDRVSWFVSAFSEGGAGGFVIAILQPGKRIQIHM
jgi:hypothetical protein